MSGLYSAMLRLAGRKCIVVGGGAVALRKLRRLLAAEAQVTVIAPVLHHEVSRLVADGRVAWEKRKYRADDMAGATLVFAATSSREVNRAIAAEAEERGVLVNVVDDPTASTLQVPAEVVHGGVTVAVSTGGRSPAFARRLREELENFLSPERLALFELYAGLRSSLRESDLHIPGSAWEAVDQQALDLLRGGRRSDAEALLRSQVLAGRGA